MDFENQYVNVGEYLRQAMTRNPHLQVLMTASVFDLATPYFDAYFTRDHLGLPPELRDQCQIQRYQAGHMMYIRKADHAKLKRDVTEFMRKGPLAPSLSRLPNSPTGPCARSARRRRRGCRG